MIPLLMKVNKIIVHCSDTEGGSMEAIRNYHINVKGWTDIGYHFVIDNGSGAEDGIIQVGRPESQVGAHCLNENHDSIGICLVGETAFTAAQLNSLMLLCQSLLRKYELDFTKVTGHYEWPSGRAQHKSCPNIPGETLRAIARGEITCV